MTNGRILIVESDAIVAMDLAESLELDGHEVRCAGNGVEGLEEAREFRPELVIVDADASGSLRATDTAYLLHEEHRSSVIYLTALPGSRRPAWLAEVLPLAFLGKPIDPSELLAVAAEGVGAHRACEKTLPWPAPGALALDCLS